jgi:hypothetical protein
MIIIRKLILLDYEIKLEQEGVKAGEVCMEPILKISLSLMLLYKINENCLDT